jgi:hypothetical protein
MIAHASRRLAPQTATTPPTRHSAGSDPRLAHSRV